MTILLALDPGGTPTAANSRSATGWSTWHYDAFTPLLPIDHGQVPGNQTRFKAWFREFLRTNEIDEIVCESFNLDGRTMYPDVTPLKIEGVIEGLWEGPLYFQPNTQKSHMRDDRIKDLGLWWKGQGHAIDSLRHAYALQKVRKHHPTILQAWPRRG